MKKIINKGLDFYEKEFRDGCSFLEDLAGSPSSGVKLDSYIKELEDTSILFDDLRGDSALPPLTLHVQVAPASQSTRRTAPHQ